MNVLADKHFDLLLGVIDDSSNFVNCVLVHIILGCCTLILLINLNWVLKKYRTFITNFEFKLVGVNLQLLLLSILWILRHGHERLLTLAWKASSASSALSSKAASVLLVELAAASSASTTIRWSEVILVFLVCTMRITIVVLILASFEPSLIRIVLFE